MTDLYQLYLDAVQHNDSFIFLKIAENEYVTFDKDASLIHRICNITPKQINGHLTVQVTDATIALLREYEYRLAVLDIAEYELVSRLYEAYSQRSDQRLTTIIQHGGKFYSFGGDAIVISVFCHIQIRHFNSLKVVAFDDLSAVAQMDTSRLKYVVHEIS